MKIGDKLREFKENLEKLVKSWGADLFGVADLKPAKEYIAENFGESLLHFSKAVVLAVYFPAEVVNELAEGPTHTYLYFYKVVNARLDDLALRVTNYLMQQGYRAFPIPASQRVTEDKLAGIFSHRLAASLAGLGWIGKNCALVNPEVGPRLRLVTILTDAPLPADQPIANRCGRCSACIDACPAQALAGGEVILEDPLEKRFKASACDIYLGKVRAAFGKRICGKCLAVCPRGQKPRKSQKMEV